MIISLEYLARITGFILLLSLLTPSDCFGNLIADYDNKTVQFYSEAHDKEFSTSLKNLSERTVTTLKNECPSKFLKLERGWDSKSLLGNEVNSIRDLATVLGMSFNTSYGLIESEKRKTDKRLERLEGVYVKEPFSGVDFSGAPPGEMTFIYGDISYLMDLEDARNSLSGAIKSGSSERIEVPGFPKGISKGQAEDLLGRFGGDVIAQRAARESCVPGNAFRAQRQDRARSEPDHLLICEDLGEDSEGKDPEGLPIWLGNSE